MTLLTLLSVMQDFVQFTGSEGVAIGPLKRAITGGAKIMMVVAWMLLAALFLFRQFSSHGPTSAWLSSWIEPRYRNLSRSAGTIGSLLLPWSHRGLTSLNGFVNSVIRHVRRIRRKLVAWLRG